MAGRPVGPGDPAPDPPRLPSAFAAGQTPRERVRAGRARTRLTFRRLSGLDRSGPPPPQTLAGQPLNPWTLPNAIGYARLALIPVFLRRGWTAPGGHDPRAAHLWAVIAWSDYADGMAARVTGQYSRLGALLDPLVDRLLVLAGVAVCFRHRLLPRTMLAVLVVREAGMLALGRYSLRRGVEMDVNWFGRAGVWPVMSAPYFAMVGRRRLAESCLYSGVPLMILATVRYGRRAAREMRAPASAPPTSPSASG